MDTTPPRFPLDLTLSTGPVRVTRAGVDALVFHKLTESESGELARDGDDIPVAPLVITDDTTDDEIIAHLNNPPAPVALAHREISKLTIRRRLRALGKEAAFDAALDAIPHARTDWDDAQTVSTGDPMFTIYADSLRAAVGLTPEQFDALLAP